MRLCRFTHELFQMRSLLQRPMAASATAAARYRCGIVSFSRRTVYSGGKEQPGNMSISQAPMARSKLGTYLSNLIMGTLVAGGAWLGLNKYRTMVARRELCGDPLPKDRHVQADLTLVRYRNCILPEWFVMKGTMEKIATFETRPDDVIVASFPKSGSMWLQEIVYLLKNPDKRTVSAENKEAESEESLLKIESPEVMDVLCPYLEYSYPGLKDISEREGGRMMKTHLPRHLLPESVDSQKNTKVTMTWIFAIL
jgi:hypothetical protein